jgi:hypothetical protein
MEEMDRNFGAKGANQERQLLKVVCAFQNENGAQSRHHQ